MTNVDGPQKGPGLAILQVPLRISLCHQMDGLGPGNFMSQSLRFFFHSVWAKKPAPAIMGGVQCLTQSRCLKNSIHYY